MNTIFERNRICDEITAHEMNDQMDRDREVKRSIAATAMVCCLIVIALCIFMMVIMP